MASLAVVRDDIVPATHRRADVRETIEELRNQNPRMGVDHLTEALCGRLTEDTHLLRAAARFVVERVLVTIETRRRLSRAAPSPRERAERRVAEQTAVERIAATVAKGALGLMIDGKRLGDHTGGELAKLGAGFARIAARVPPRARVNSCLSEAQAAQLLDLKAF